MESAYPRPNHHLLNSNTTDAGENSGSTRKNLENATTGVRRGGRAVNSPSEHLELKPMAPERSAQQNE
ncbi:unnamed protein product [Larinioides sclopetarius]|uniref:Uncharacterized protein n=1 Tax=Larinioides sclopetarius TaxID=280406 RepID=A0AAV2AQ47_9ARAC